jgi:hypothetical protein
MENNAAVIYSFCLYVLYVLLPLIPALLIFKLFPDTKVTVSGPLQNLTLNATGAFAGYVVTVALGFFLVRNVASQIEWTRHYPVEGIIADLSKNQVINSDRFFSRYTNASQDAGGQFSNRDYDFVILSDHPVTKPETIWLDYWEFDGPGGVGAPPSPKKICMQLEGKSTRYRLQAQQGNVVVVPEARLTLPQ